MEKSNIWLIWLAVMWENLAKNIANNWFKISIYNRSNEKTEKIINEWYNSNLHWKYNITEFVESLEIPRKIIIMVKAWEAVDQTIEQLIPHLNKEDIIIDAWNSFYKDTIRRYNNLKNIWIHFIWCWVSGWEEWALKWPSIMPWWDRKAYDKIENILKSIAAKDFKENKCVSYIWNDWSWHFVKMVHNWIEYSIMQMMSEWYDLLRKVYWLKADEIANIFSKYNWWKLNSYLFEISVKILNKKDEDWWFLIDKILDKAWAKWTWLWTAIEWLENWISLNTISSAVDARNLSYKKEIRTKLSDIYWFDRLKNNNNNMELNVFINKLENALYTWMLISYSQWLEIIRNKSEEREWNIELSEITRIWQWWCIIRAKILDYLTNVFNKNKEISNILTIPEISTEIKNNIKDYQDIINLSNNNFIPLLSLSAWLNYLYFITSKESSANFIQWQRDFFWAHTYERNDKKWVFHTEWQ